MSVKSARTLQSLHWNMWSPTRLRYMYCTLHLNGQSFVRACPFGITTCLFLPDSGAQCTCSNVYLVVLL